MEVQKGIAATLRFPEVDADPVSLSAPTVTVVRDSDGVLKTATMQQLANLFASLAALNLATTILSAPTALTTEQYVVFNSAGALAITLPPSSLNTGRRFAYVNKGAGTVTITPDGSDTIAGAANLVLAQYDGGQLISDGLGMWGSV